jgi:spore maturation protein A
MGVMNYLWAAMGIVGIVWGLAAGRGGQMTQGTLNAAMEAVALCVRLAGGFALWSGMLAILERAGVIDGLTRAAAPLMRRLFPGAAPEARNAIAMNLTANVLGLGNAATPMGLEAMRQMGGDAPNGAATDAMCMFLVINASSVQLFPTTVIALRAAAGSAAPASILLPTLAATLISTAVGVLACVGLRRVWGAGA